MGKTMLMTYLHAIPALVSGVKVVSDYKLNWKGDNISYFNPEEFDELCMTWRNCIVLIDEIGAILDSREFKDEGSNTRKFFSYHRKHHVELICSTQHVSLVAKTAKNLITDWYICSDATKSSILINWISKFIRFKGVILKTEKVSLEYLAQETGDLSPETPIIFGTREKGMMYWLRDNMLVRNDLNEMKAELTYSGCKDCNTRFTEIDKEDTKNDTVCPLCLTENIGEITAIMYDTDYELPNKFKEVRFVTQIPSPAGDRWIPANPPLTPEQAKQKKQLQAKFI